MRYIIVCLTLLLLITSCSKNIIGIYKYDSYLVVNEIELLKDSTFQFKHKGDLGSAMSYGKWFFEDNYLVLNSADSCAPISILERVVDSLSSVLLYVNYEDGAIPFFVVYADKDMNTPLVTNRQARVRLTTTPKSITVKTMSGVYSYTIRNRRTNFISVIVRRYNDDLFYINNSKFKIKCHSIESGGQGGILKYKKQ